MDFEIRSVELFKRLTNDIRTQAAKNPVHREIYDRNSMEWFTDALLYLGGCCKGSEDIESDSNSYWSVSSANDVLYEIQKDHASANGCS